MALPVSDRPGVLSLTRPAAEGVRRAGRTRPDPRRRVECGGADALRLHPRGLGVWRTHAVSGSSARTRRCRRSFPSADRRSAASRSRRSSPPNSVRPTPSCSCCRRRAPTTSTKGSSDPDATDAQVLAGRARRRGHRRRGRFLADLHLRHRADGLDDVLLRPGGHPVRADSRRAVPAARRPAQRAHRDCGGRRAARPRFTSRRTAAGTAGCPRRWSG